MLWRDRNMGIRPVRGARKSDGCGWASRRPHQYGACGFAVAISRSRRSAPQPQGFAPQNASSRMSPSRIGPARSAKRCRQRCRDRHGLLRIAKNLLASSSNEDRMCGPRVRKTPTQRRACRARIGVDRATTAEANALNGRKSASPAFSWILGFGVGLGQHGTAIAKLGVVIPATPPEWNRLARSHIAVGDSSSVSPSARHLDLPRFTWARTWRTAACTERSGAAAAPHRGCAGRERHTACEAIEGDGKVTPCVDWSRRLACHASADGRRLNSLV